MHKQDCRVFINNNNSLIPRLIPSFSMNSLVPRLIPTCSFSMLHTIKRTGNRPMDEAKFQTTINILVSRLIPSFPKFHTGNRTGNEPTDEAKFQRALSQLTCAARSSAFSPQSASSVTQWPVSSQRGRGQGTAHRPRPHPLSS